jgi:hypothetical protein
MPADGTPTSLCVLPSMHMTQKIVSSAGQLFCTPRDFVPKLRHRFIIVSACLETRGSHLTFLLAIKTENLNRHPSSNGRSCGLPKVQVFIEYAIGSSKDCGHLACIQLICVIVIARGTSLRPSGLAATMS